MDFTFRTRTMVLRLSGLLAAFGASGAYAVAPDLARAIPADVAAAYFWQGGLTKDQDGVRRIGDIAARLAAGAQQVGLLGLIDPALRPWADASAAAIVAGQYPFALAVFEARAALREGETPGQAVDGHRLSDLRAALVLITHKQNAEIERQIQHLLLTYTNKAYSTLTSVGGSPPARFSLRDLRLPEWCEISWGPIGDYYVVTIGSGSFERVLKTVAQSRTALGRNEWFSSASNELDLKNAAVGLYLRPGTIVVDPDAGLRQKVARVRSALNLAATNRGLWTLHVKDRAIEIELLRSVARIGTRGKTPDTSGALDAAPRYQNERRTLASGLLPQGAPRGLVPLSAKRYTVIEWEASAALDAVSRAYLMSRSPGAQADLRAFWRDVERDSGISIRDDIFSHLGPYVVIHNYPPHALRLPLAWTYVVPIDGSPDLLRANIDKLFHYAQDRLGETATIRLRRDRLETPAALPEFNRPLGETPDAAADKSIVPGEDSPPSASRPDIGSNSIKATTDDKSSSIWYLFAGLNGPALAVTDEYLVISYAPHALQSNLPRLRGEAKGNVESGAAGSP